METWPNALAGKIVSSHSVLDAWVICCACAFFCYVFVQKLMLVLNRNTEAEAPPHAD